MKVLMLESFEGIPEVPRGTGPMIPKGIPRPRAVAGKDEKGNEVKIYAMPGGSFAVDWGDPGVQAGALAFVGQANVKFWIGVLDDAEKAKLLK
jgi:hypothetical protein